MHHATLCSLLLPLLAGATHSGDEIYRVYTGGQFYVFCNDGSISIVDPDLGTVVKNITDLKGLVSSWGDVVYQIDRTHLHRYVYANDRTRNRLITIDADSQTIVGEASLLVGPVHLYGVFYKEEVWAHSDTKGSFDIASLTDPGFLSQRPRKAFNTIPGHGKLLWDEALVDTLFASNVNEGGIVELSRNSVDSPTFWAFGTSNGFTCGGTHGVSYSVTTQSIFVECLYPALCCRPNTTGCANSDPANFFGPAPDLLPNTGAACTGAIFEFNVPNRTVVGALTSPYFLQGYNLHVGLSGVIWTPDHLHPLAFDTKFGLLHLLVPDANGTQVFDIPVAGAADKPSFVRKAQDSKYGHGTHISEYIMFAGQTTGAGFVYIDMANVLSKTGVVFPNGPVIVNYIDLGSKVPAAINGGVWVAGTTDPNAAGDFQSVSFVNAVDIIKGNPPTIKKVTGLAKAKSIAYVPYRLWDTQYAHDLQISDLTAQLQSQRDQTDMHATVVGSVGCALSCLALALSAAALLSAWCNRRASDSGDWKSTPRPPSASGSVGTTVSNFGLLQRHGSAQMQTIKVGESEA